MNSLRKVAVVGMGYVGLPLALAITEKSEKVIGIDISKEKINLLNQGITEIPDCDSSELLYNLSRSKIIFATDFRGISEADVILICVPTPLGNNGKSDLTSLLNAVKDVSEQIKKNALIIIESTVATGTTREIIDPIIRDVSNFARGEYHLAYSPERVDPGNKFWKIKNTTKLVSGIDAEACRLAFNFYNDFIDEIHICETLEIAETAKLLENSFRLVNISFINEFSIFCHEYSLDVNKVIEAASTKPFGFMPFYPSLGAGGHCIPVDPVYLSEVAGASGSPLNVINLALEINQKMPSFHATRAEKILRTLKEKKILVIGIAFKPNISDTRESPAKHLINILRAKGALVWWHDDLVGEWNGEKSVTLGENYDLAILATSHNYFDLSNLRNLQILDTHGSLS